jgi:hypothetical protein
MNEQIISEKEVSKALDYLRDSAAEVKDHLDISVSAQEREAYASDEYTKHLRALQMAIEIDEKHKFMRVAAEAKINAWQTMSANYRSIKL